MELLARTSAPRPMCSPVILCIVLRDGREKSRHWSESPEHSKPMVARDISGWGHWIDMAQSLTTFMFPLLLPSRHVFADYSPDVSFLKRVLWADILAGFMGLNAHHLLLERTTLVYGSMATCQS